MFLRQIKARYLFFFRGRLAGNFLGFQSLRMSEGETCRWRSIEIAAPANSWNEIPTFAWKDFAFNSSFAARYTRNFVDRLISNWFFRLFLSWINYHILWNLTLSNPSDVNFARAKRQSENTTTSEMIAGVNAALRVFTTRTRDVFDRMYRTVLRSWGTLHQERDTNSRVLRQHW